MDCFKKKKHPKQLAIGDQMTMGRFLILSGMSEALQETILWQRHISSHNNKNKKEPTGTEVLLHPKQALTTSKCFTPNKSANPQNNSMEKGQFSPPFHRGGNLRMTSCPGLPGSEGVPGM